ncbi:MAG: L-serine ammonia-lyase, iron-sulfur-dependent, subunit alpha [Aminobacterium sp.]|jgi:L-serine dehydratase|nr:MULTISPECIES: L-serine ammonia-lyase, iron-sulfur-dependent, subunit alpha [unclassified Aminobacterium]MDD2206363.1 L-serine ammonia-lyase, iron-sulfur-dependent, subunit alpha [Aminobacterium sp.]MDD3426165.1 L-serine ammonia-lyase, iron-sulfur-dependent, subunit alpha [Aminobacterium sp.]MDD3707490.1 L-serine ammonia-lyase, iron-sulfur-dependent, subunit alpha [Aminobacterium sp.]MDD4228380.1 L-serine ammonia-lyase, iron-sulfur-dependent, subunit alpha [Aminobacterium sp.]MDD4552276.1 L-
MRSISELVAQSLNQKSSFVEVVLSQEEQETGLPVDRIRERMKSRLVDMEKSVHDALEHEWNGKIVRSDRGKLASYAQKEKNLSGQYILRASEIALAVATYNAAMGRIVAAPTAGSCGILPGLLFAHKDIFATQDKTLLDGLIVAGSIGSVIASRATLAGAEGGCQAECGAAAAMGAAALVAMHGGISEAIEQSVALTFKSVLGLVCDPVGGLVESPCIKRNGLLVSVAALAADMALAGIKSIIPADEVIDAMAQVGRALPESLRETAHGGLAITPTARRLVAEILHERW